MPAPEAKNQVFFFDLYGTLINPRGQAVAARPDVSDWMLLAENNRLGVLANLPPGLHVSELRRTLEAGFLKDFFDPTLLLVASDLPTPLPDVRAFAAAAALAGRPVGECRFVSNNPALRKAAEAAGMTGMALSGTPPARGTRLLAGESAAAALVPEVDGDAGPTYILKGRVVTMSDDGDKIIDDARILITKGKIAGILKPAQPVPAAFKDAPTVDTGCTLYPGMIDLHNHFAYNILPLWTVPKHFDDRSQWPRHADYKPLISLPTTAIAGFSDTARALVRYVETKAIIGGVTTGQGIRTKVSGGIKLFHGSMRNVEETKDARLPEAATLVPDLFVKDKSKVLAFRRGLENHTAYFYHLAEGIDKAAEQHFQDLVDKDLLRPSLVGIHSLGPGRKGTQTTGLKALAKAGAKVVWSPFSNILLYGETVDVKALVSSGVLFCIGCDWAPTGSKNLLEELKVARFEANRQEAHLSAEDLVRAVTVNAARVCGWEKWLGTLKAGAFCDLVAINGVKGQDVFKKLIDATEADIMLVVVHGVPRYGDRALMQKLHFDTGNPLENVKMAGANRALYLHSEDSGTVDLSFSDARDTLKKAMDDLPAFVKKAKAGMADLRAAGIEPAFTVELDMDPGGPSDIEAAAASPPKIADSIPLDPPEVGAGDYWKRIKAQANLPEKLKQELQSAY